MTKAASNVQSIQPAGAPPANLALWERLKRTDPKATKPFTRAGGFRGTQIDPTWRLMRMTEEFGPVGQGWGWDQPFAPVVTHNMVFIGARVWYRNGNGEECWTGVQWGGTELMRRKRDGTEEPNDESFKMAVTDAVGKCLVQLGLAADVHMGLFDDSKYREESEAYFAAKGDPELSPEAIAKFDAAVKRLAGAVADLDSLDELWRDGCKEAEVPPVSAKLREIGKVDKTAQHRIVAYFSQRKADLLGAKKPPAAVAADKPARDEAFFSRDDYGIDPRPIGWGKWEQEYRAKLGQCRTAHEQQRVEADNCDWLIKFTDKNPAKAEPLRLYQNECWNRFVDEPALDAMANGRAEANHMQG